MPQPFEYILSHLDSADAENVGRPVAAPDWWVESFSAPEPFFAGLLGGQVGRGGLLPKSAVGRGYDFYYDAVLRFLPDDARRPVLRCYDPEAGWQALTLGALHAQSNRLVAEWAQRGVEPEAVLALVLPPGPQLVVGLLTALRLGACASFIPPLGPTFVDRRLKALKPAHVLTTRLYLPLVKTWQPILLDRPLDNPGVMAGYVAERPERVRSHTFAPDAPALAVFSPLRDPPDVPVLLPSQVAYLHALRDGVFVYGLRPGEILAAPGVRPLQVQPALLLSALLSGATLLDCEPAHLANMPTLLQREPLRALLICEALRDALKALPLPGLGKLGRWFRNPQEPLDPLAWRDFIKALRLESVPHANLAVDAAAGGAVLVAGGRRGEVHSFVLPAPGCQHALLDINMSGQPAVGAVALLMATPPGDEKQPGHMMLLAQGGGYHYGGTCTPRRVGWTYPTAAVLAVLEAEPRLVGASVVAVANAGANSRDLFVLVLFTGADAATGPSALKQDVEQLVRYELGRDALPDEVEVYPLYPRRGPEGPESIDHEWVRMQFLRGALHRKAGTRAFKLLTALRRYAVEPAGGAP